VLMTAATATLSLGLSLSGVAASPYQQTRADTAGPDIVATSNSLPGGRVPAALTDLARAPGVTAAGGPYPLLNPVMKIGRRTVDQGFAAVGRTVPAAAIDQPRLTAGSWVRPGGVVVEPTYAAEAGVGLGTRITLDGHPFRVVGLAVTAAWPSVNAPGLMWLTEADARSLENAADPPSYLLELRVKNPAQAAALAARYTSTGPGSTSVFAQPWQQIASQDARQLQIEEAVLVAGAWLLGMLAIASVAVLVGARMTEQGRRVGLLKAVGARPRTVAAIMLAEQLVVAVAAALAGLVIGWLAAPLLTSPADGLLGAPGAPRLTAATAGLVIAMAVLVALLATLGPAVRAARTSTVAALDDRARTPHRSRTFIRLSRRLPVPLLLGLRLAGRRPRRMILGAASVAVTVGAMIGAVNMLQRAGTHRVPGGLINPVDTAADHILLIITAMLIVLAAVNAVFVAAATVRDSRRPMAVARSLGASPEQVSAGVSASQLAGALPGALLGVPFGIALIAAFSHGGSPVVPSAWGLLGVVLLALAGIAALTAGPARAGARQPAAQILREEP
jgi:putative ABC transport system permease protein